MQNLTVHRLCHQRVINAVNGGLPGPLIRVHEGDTLVVHVFNKSPYNLTIHWYNYSYHFLGLGDSAQGQQRLLPEEMASLSLLSGVLLCSCLILVWHRESDIYKVFSKFVRYPTNSEKALQVSDEDNFPRPIEEHFKNNERFKSSLKDPKCVHKK